MAADEAMRRAEGRRNGWFRLLLVVPAVVFSALVLAFALGLGRDPDVLPSPLLGKKMPQFSLLPVRGRSLGLATGDLKGKVSLVNVFASWCVACREEHPLLMQLKAQGVVPIDGIDYKDKPEDAARWLDAMADPYARTGADFDGRVAIDWGVYGVPETYVINREGFIALKQVGPITPDLLRDKILPLVERLRR